MSLGDLVPLPLERESTAVSERQVELASQLILVGAALILLSIVAGLVSSRLGAPLLLVFLALGMLAGEDGPGGILFDDFHAGFLIGSVALAIILFDGGLHTRFSSFRLALGPALVLATLGVLITAGITALFASLVLDLGWIEAVLVGAIVSSTDAAAVFFMLRMHGLSLQQRVSTTLEIESGINDPMAIFLTLTCVELLQMGVTTPGWSVLGEFVLQMGGGALIGLAGGYALLWLVNRLEIASGLYPIFVVSFALSLFAGAQVLGASGFVAVYLAGLILGNRRHRASQMIERFHEGLSWLSQIVMFLILGLLVTPHTLIPGLPAAIFVAVMLMLVARPIAVWVCLAPFRFRWREIAFIAWVGLRGAVPIFLATAPVLAGLPGARVYFDLAFVAVLVSLVCQGWSVARVARALDLDLPPTLQTPERTEFDVPAVADRSISGYAVRPRSPVVEHDLGELPLPQRSAILSVIRDGAVLDRAGLTRLEAGDYALTVAPAEAQPHLDRLFGARAPDHARDEVYGEFTFDAALPANVLATLYGIPITPGEAAQPLGEVLLQHLDRLPVVGDRVRLGEVELVVREMDGDRITRVGIELDPAAQERRSLDLLVAPLRRWRERLTGWRGR
jgi:cell volume regulation protein A